MQGAKVTLDRKTMKVIGIEEIEIDKEPDRTIDHMLTEKAINFMRNYEGEKKQ